MRSHGLPSPKFRAFLEGGSRVVMVSEREALFPRAVRCIFTPPTYTVMVEGFVVAYDTLTSYDGSSIEDRLLRTLFDVMLEYVIED